MPASRWTPVRCLAALTDTQLAAGDDCAIALARGGWVREGRHFRRMRAVQFLKRREVSVQSQEGSHHGDSAFSTWPNSSSTGVTRPKIVTATLTRERASSTPSTTPRKDENGPAFTRTMS